MMFTRKLVTLAVGLTLLAHPGCSPADPRTRLESALVVLQSDASAVRKANACTEVRTALAEYPHDAADRQPLTERAARALVGALRDPRSRREAEEALVSLGIASFEPLFDAVLDTDPGTQQGAATCLVRMSVTTVPVLIPALLSDDLAAQDRATRILTRLGKPISPTLRMYYARILEPYAGQTASDAATGPTALSSRGRAGIIAFARVFGSIGDESSVLALMDGCEALRRAYPDVAIAHLRIIEDLGPAAITSLSSAHQRDFDRLKILVETR